MWTAKLLQDDADQYVFTLEGDEGRHTFWLSTQESLELFETVDKCVGEFWREGQAVKNGRRPLDSRPEDDGYALDDPKHPTYYERMVD